MPSKPTTYYDPSSRSMQPVTKPKTVKKTPRPKRTPPKKRPTKKKS